MSRPRNDRPAIDLQGMRRTMRRQQDARALSLRHTAGVASRRRLRAEQAVTVELRRSYAWAVPEDEKQLIEVARRICESPAAGFRARILRRAMEEFEAYRTAELSATAAAQKLDCRRDLAGGWWRYFIDERDVIHTAEQCAPLQLRGERAALQPQLSDVAPDDLRSGDSPPATCRTCFSKATLKARAPKPASLAA